MASNINSPLDFFHIEIRKTTVRDLYVKTKTFKFVLYGESLVYMDQGLYTNTCV